MNINEMKVICKAQNIDLKYCNYPYAAWYSKSAYDNHEYVGYWFAEN